MFSRSDISIFIARIHHVTDLTNMAKLVTLIVLATLLLVFILQNAAPVVVNFLVWEIESPRAVVLFLIFLGGLITGILLMLYLNRNKKKSIEAPPIRYS